MGDSLKVTSVEGFGSRMANSLKSVVLGAVVFLGSFFVLWWNEGNIVAEKAALKEMQEKVVSADAKAPNTAHDGKLIHATGDLSSEELLSDGNYLKPGPWLKLNRNVEMYQWVEKEDSESTTNVGGSKTTTTTYSYTKEWASGRVDHTSFQRPEGHENPALPVEPESFQVNSASFGAFDGLSVLGELGDGPIVKVTNDMLLRPGMEIQDGMVYLRKNADSAGPQIGDVRLTYRAVTPGVYSIMAVQHQGEYLAPYRATNGKEKFLVEQGRHDAPAMIQSATDAAKVFAMIMRVVGFVAMWIGLTMLLSPFTTLLDVIPFLGSIGRFAAGAASFVISAVLSTVTIVVAMIAHNPIALLVVVAASIGGGVYALKRRAANKTAASANSNNETAHQSPRQAA